MYAAAEPSPTSSDPARQADDTEGSESAAEVVAENPNLIRLGRIGWVAKALVYLLAGLLAALVALRSMGWAEQNESDEASPTGAIKEVAQHTFGGPVLIVLAAGLALYAGWRLVSAVMPGPKEFRARITRAGYLVSAVMYGSFAFTAAKLVVVSPKTEDGDGTVTSIADGVIRNAAGRWVFGAVGVGILAVGLYRANKGRTLDVTDEMTLGNMSTTRRTWLRRLGAFGEIGRGLALGMIGWFFLLAAVTYEPERATGLDGALQRAASHGVTRVLVPLVALGFIAYGMFCLATFTRRRFEAPG